MSAAAAAETSAAPVVAEPTVPQSAGPTDPSVGPAAPESAPAAVVAEDAPVAATEAKPAEGAANAPGTTAEHQVEPNKAQITAKPVTSGVLGYKAPGLIPALRFKKQYFWLGDEAVTAKDLHQYLRGTKPEIAQPVAAWASQTGKGLLFSSKDEKKGAIAEVFPLADATFITKEGNLDFTFRVGPKKHQLKFQAANQDERNGWVVAITVAHEDAKKEKETIEGSDGYKNSLKELKEPSKAATGAAAATGATAAAGAGAAATAAASKDSKDSKDSKEASKEAETPKDAPKEAAKKDTKERSQSRKRASIFGGFGKKKEEKAEEKEAKKEEKEEKEAKKEEKAEKKEEKKEEKEEKKEEAKTEDSKAHKVEAAAVAGGAAITAGTAAAAAHAKETDKVANEKAEKAIEPTKENDKAAASSAERSKSKRRSGIFGLFDKKQPAPEKEAKKDDAQVEAFKDDPVAAADHKESSVKKEEQKPVEAFKNDPVAPEKEAKKENAATGAAGTGEKVTTPSDKEKRRSSFFGLGQKFGSVRNKQPKEAKADEVKPAAVAESKTEDKVAAPAAATEEAKPAPTEAAKEEPKAIGDVVPEAVSVGQEQVPAATNGAATAPAVTTSA